MRPNTQDRPGTVTGATREADDKNASTSITELADQARRLVEEAEQCHPDLSAWAQGFVSGWDAAVSAVIRQRLDELGETIALHDRQRWGERGHHVREDRVRREIAEMEAHAARIRAEVYGEAS